VGNSSIILVPQAEKKCTDANADISDLDLNPSSADTESSDKSDPGSVPEEAEQILRSSLRTRWRLKTNNSSQQTGNKKVKKGNGILKESYCDLLIGIPKTEINKRKDRGECFRCTWPSNRKRAHWARSCIRKVKVTCGIAT
jgi:hypothetical protein